MPTLEFKTEIDAPLAKVWEFHSTLDGLKKVTPPSTKVDIVAYEPPLRAGSKFTLLIRRNGIPIRWEVEYEAFDPPDRFVDRQIAGKGPFQTWRHEHMFVKISEKRTLLHDRVTYEAPFGIFGVIADHLFLKNDLKKMFAYRHRVTKELIEAS